MSDTNPTESAALDSSAMPPVVSGAADPVPAVTPERFNGLMALYNKEQNARKLSDTEVERLQGLLAIAVVSEKAAKDRVMEFEQGQGAQAQALTQQEATSQAQRTTLTNQVADLTALNSRLRFLFENKDILDYSEVLPATGDRAVLERAAATIRTARDTEQTRMRDHMVGIGKGSGGPGRVTPQTWTAKQINEYLAASPPGEFERRLAEVTGGKSAQ